jgi:phosphoglycerol transferase MdoB-like AlkP superfamily enzyme
LTETPLTSLSKSLASNIVNNYKKTGKEIPHFDDRIFSSSGDAKSASIDILEKYRKKYNVILIVLETTNNQLLHPSGALADYLPNLKKLARKGLYLPRFFTPFPRSAKAFFAIQTGFYPLTNYKSMLRIAPNLNIPTIFSVLKDHKYNTFAAYSGDFNYDRMADFLVDRKVDRLVDMSENDGTYKEVSWGVDDELIYNKLIDWIDTLGYDSPFFAFLLPINTHHPFWTPKKELKIVPEHDQFTRYINAIHYQDFLIGRLIDFLDDTARLPNTIIIVTGDHGTVFNSLKTEHNTMSLYSLDTNSINVPFYLYFHSSNSVKLDPNIIGSHIDIFPTILDLVGIKLKTEVQGKSIFDPTIRDRVSFVYNDYNHNIVVALSKQWFLLKDINQSSGILSKNLHFDVDYCEDQNAMCTSLLQKVHEFERFQNNRLLTHLK